MGINPQHVRRRFERHIVPPGNQPIHRLLGNFQPPLVPRRPRRRGRTPSPPAGRRRGRRPDGGIPTARRINAATRIQRAFRRRPRRRR